MSLRKSAVYLSIMALVACHRSDPAALVGSAKDHLAKREYSAAIIQLKNALQMESSNTEARYLLGLASLENGDFASADMELSKAKQSGYGGEELDLALARTMLGRGEYARLISEFRATKLSSPSLQAELQATVGAAQLAQNQRNEARLAFEESLVLDASSVTANIGLARLSTMDGDLPGALTRLEVALKAAPDRGEALLLKADLLAAQGRTEGAESAYRDAAAAPGYEVTGRAALIGYLLRNRSLDKAANEVAAMEKAGPKDLRTAYAKASVLNAQGNYAAASEAILQVLKVAPNHVPSLIIAGTAAFETGAYADAESHFRKAVQSRPEALLAKRWLIVTHLRMGQIDAALAEVKELLAGAPEDPGVAALAGEVYLASGDVAAAARHYERAKSLVPDNATVQTRLALLRLAAGEVDRGVKELEASSASHPQDYRADLALIATYLRQRQADKALEAVNGLAKKQPDNPVTYNLRGLALLLKRDDAGARASFEQSLKLNPAFMPALSNLVQLDLRDKNPSAAKSRYQAVLKSQPDNEQALSGLAVLLRITGAPKEEIEKPLKQAVLGNPNSPNARVALINFYLRNADPTKALTAAQEARVALPNSAAVTEALARAQLAGGDSAQAMGTYQKLVEMSPKAPQPLIQLARAQLGAQKYDEAIKSLRAALALRPDLAAVERDIAGIYVATGRYEEALAEARSVQKERPDQPLGYMLEGEVQLAQRKFDAAETTYRGALQKFDIPVIALRTHAVMTAGGKGPQADAMAEKWVSSHPKDISVIVYLAQRDAVEKRYAEAERRYHIALQREPNNALVLNNLAWISNELKQPKAREYAERANELAPDTPQIMDTLGSILAESGERERGLQLLGRAAELAPQAYPIRLNFAKALVKAGRKDAARKELETLAKLDPKLPVQQEAAALLSGL